MSRRWPHLHESEAGTPQRSPSGRALRGSADDLTAWDDANVLPYVPAGIRARAGDFVNQDFPTLAVVHRRHYAGRAPLSLQPAPTLPPPWER